MGYVKTIWQNGKTPLNADNMNHIEDGIADSEAQLESFEEETTERMGSIEESVTALADKEIVYELTNDENASIIMNAYAELMIDEELRSKFMNASAITVIYVNDEDETQRIRLEKQVYANDKHIWLSHAPDSYRHYRGGDLWMLEFERADNHPFLYCDERYVSFKDEPDTSVDPTKAYFIGYSTNNRDCRPIKLPPLGTALYQHQVIFKTEWYEGQLSVSFYLINQNSAKITTLEQLSEAIQKSFAVWRTNNGPGGISDLARNVVPYESDGVVYCNYTTVKYSSIQPFGYHVYQNSINLTESTSTSEIVPGTITGDTVTPL